PAKPYRAAPVRPVAATNAPLWMMPAPGVPPSTRGPHRPRSLRATRPARTGPPRPSRQGATSRRQGARPRRFVSARAASCQAAPLRVRPRRFRVRPLRFVSAGAPYWRVSANRVPLLALGPCGSLALGPCGSLALGPCGSLAPGPCGALAPGPCGALALGACGARSEPVAAREHLLQRVRGGGDQLQRALEFIDLEVGQRQRMPERHEVAGQCHAAADGIADAAERGGQVDRTEFAERRLELNPLLA